MYDVFLSYRRESGSEFASFLFKELKDMGYDVFFDAKSIRAGVFDKQIDSAIEQCTFFLVLLAPNDLARCFSDPENDWIVHELKIALNNGKIVVPIAIKEGFTFPPAGAIKELNELSRIQLCDVSGVSAADMVGTKLLSFLNDYPAKKLAYDYNNGIITPEYIAWELATLKSIYNDIPFVSCFGKEYPAYIIQGSESVRFPFNELTQNGKLEFECSPLPFEQLPWYNEFKKIVGPHVHFPNLYGYTSNGFLFDDNGKVCGYNAVPRTYRETVYTCHILQYELWSVYQKIGSERLATLDDLPMRKAIHAERTNMDVILSGCNRSSLSDISIAVIDYNDRTEEYCVASAVRTEQVATFPGYFSFVPSGGFELYELEQAQNESVIKENFSIVGALFREYIEELFGDSGFGKPTGDDDLNRLFRNDKIKALRKGVRDGSYKFEFLGVDFDLITLRQTFAFVLRIDDENFFYDNEIKKNEENIYVKFVSLRNLSEYIQKEKVPVMAETAATYALLQSNHLYREIKENDYGLIL